MVEFDDPPPPSYEPVGESGWFCFEAVGLAVLMFAAHVTAIASFF